jgi:hypothetical protein
VGASATEDRGSRPPAGTGLRRTAPRCSPAGQVDAVDRHANTENRGLERKVKVVLDHGVQAHDLLVLVVAVHLGFVDQRTELRRIHPAHRGRLSESRPSARPLWGSGRAINVGGVPDAIAITHNGKTGYVSGGDADSVVAIRTATNRVQKVLKDVSGLIAMRP